MSAELVLVLGLGRSGYAAAEHLLSGGYHVVAVDGGDGPAVMERARRLHEHGAGVLTSCTGLPDIDFKFCIASPGVPLDSPWMKELGERGVEVMSELEWGWRNTTSRVLAVTGSNGKSTVVNWLTGVLQAMGQKAEAVGNYGPPLTEAVRREKHPDWWVVEVSSFQLETIRSFRPAIGVFLNLLPNHLDRHGTMEAYEQAKLRLFEYMGEGTTGIIPRKLADTLEPHGPAGISWKTFGAGEGADYRWTGEGVQTPTGETHSLAGTLFQGNALGLNAAAGLATCEALGGKAAQAVAMARTLPPLPHRLETVGSAKGVVVVNDSKATNLAAMEAALRAVHHPVRLIAGGRLKEKNLNPVKEVLAEKVRAVYLIGAAAEPMREAWGEVVPCVVTHHLDKAVTKALEEAQAGETLLLSPGCTSFDQFGGFEERGCQFTELVNQCLKED